MKNHAWRALGIGGWGRACSKLEMWPSSNVISGMRWGGGAKGGGEEVGVLLELFGVDDVGVLAAGGPELVIEEIESGFGVDHRVDL